MERRGVFYDNGTARDISVDLNNYHSGSRLLDIISSQDTIFIGSILPFNHFHIKFGSTKNALESALIVSLWDGRNWQNTFEVVDQTSDGTATFKKDGLIQFTPDKKHSWGMDDTVDSSGSTQITNLGGMKIYDRYWAALNFTNSLTSNLEIAWVGNIFSDDTALYSEYPEFSNSDTKTQFASGKTTWEEQHKIAADIIIKDLKSKKIIVSGDQILERENLQLASVQKVAQIIYGSFGDDYAENRLDAKKEYCVRLDSANVKVDTNSNARVDRAEHESTVNRIFR